MAENKTLSGALELVYVPDTYTDAERQEGASWPLGSGFYDVVFVVEGARLVLQRIKAGAVDKQFALAKERKQQQPPEQQPPEQQPPQGDEQSGERRGWWGSQGQGSPPQQPPQA